MKHIILAGVVGFIVGLATPYVLVLVAYMFDGE